jgi:hypothetical protein
MKLILFAWQKPQESVSNLYTLHTSHLTRPTTKWTKSKTFKNICVDLSCIQMLVWCCLHSDACEFKSAKDCIMQKVPDVFFRSAKGAANFNQELRACSHYLICGSCKKAIACDTPDVKNKCFIYTSVCAAPLMTQRRSLLIVCSVGMEVQFYAIHNCFNSGNCGFFLTPAINLCFFISFIIIIFALLKISMPVCQTKKCIRQKFPLA